MVLPLFALACACRLEFLWGKDFPSFGRACNTQYSGTLPHLGPLEGTVRQTENSPTLQKDKC